MRRRIRRARHLAVVYIAAQCLILQGCSESLASLQGFIGPLMGIFQGVMSVSSFDKYDTSPENFQRSRDGYSQIAGGLSTAGAELSRQQEAGRALDELPADIEAAEAERSRLQAMEDDIEGDLRALERDGKGDSDEADRLRQQLGVVQRRQRDNASVLRDLNRTYERAGEVRGRDVETTYERDRERRQREDDLIWDEMNGLEPGTTTRERLAREDESGGSSSFRDRGRQAGDYIRNNPSIMTSLAQSAGS